MRAFPGTDLQAFTESVLASVAAGVIVYDAQLRYVAWNAFMEELTGISAEQVRGRALSDLFPHLNEYGLEALHRRALAGETVSSPDIRFAGPEAGSTRWIVAQYRPNMAPDGRIIGVVATIHDITERKQAEELARIREQRFRSIIENASDMIAILDAEGTTLYESPSNERMLGYKPEELVGRNALELIHPED